MLDCLRGIPAQPELGVLPGVVASINLVLKACSCDYSLLSYLSLYLSVSSFPGFFGICSSLYLVSLLPQPSLAVCHILLCGCVLPPSMFSLLSSF